ncbi:MAG TPA: hypothetical protein PLU53_10090 [Bacteroidia bacterium]|nr:hypothetical protein [Bacteroidia bacterium]
MKTNRPFPVYILCTLLLILSISALAAGFSFITDPGGKGIGIDLSYISRTPFKNFLLPGLILFICIGILPLLVFAGLIFRPEWKAMNLLNIYPNKHWAWTYSLYSGIVLIAWIAVQITMVDYFFLQPVCIALGLFILILTLLPSVQEYYTKEQNHN